MKDRIVICLVLLAIAYAVCGCTIASKPTTFDRNDVLRHLFANRKEMAAEVEYKRYLVSAETK